MSNEQRKQTEGEYRVGVNFNPSNSITVNAIKMRAAELIDMMNELTHMQFVPGAREAAIAATKFEEAAMWAVKAVTKQPRD